MAAEPSGLTLQPTALVHEAFLRLVGAADSPQWNNRSHFFAAAAEATRRILIDSARRRKRERHGGEHTRVPLPDDVLQAPTGDEDLLAVHEVVDQLAGHDPAAAELVKLHVFAGLSIEEAATLTGVSARTGSRTWEYARAWMFRRLGGEAGN